MTVLKDSSDQNKKSSTKWNQNQKMKTEKKRRRTYLRNYKENKEFVAHAVERKKN
jgi:hypothetical protein